jgi:hypothetical protein
VSSRWKFFGFVLIVAAISIVLLVFHESVQEGLKLFFYYVEVSGVWGMVVYSLIFGLATV